MALRDPPKSKRIGYLIGYAVGRLFSSPGWLKIRAEMKVTEWRMRRLHREAGKWYLDQLTQQYLRQRGYTVN